MRDPIPLTRSVSLRVRVTLLAATVVGVAVAVMAAAAYGVIYRAMYSDVDAQLSSRADGMTTLSQMGILGDSPESLIAGTFFSNDVSAALVLPGNQAFQVGSVPIGTVERKVIDSQAGQDMSTLRTVNNRRVLARKLDDGTTLILAQDLARTDDVLHRLAWVLAIVGGCGVILAAVAGTTVARAGLRPVARLTQAADRVARTDDLRPIPVTGSDELARLTESFNLMLRALAESRDRQSRLVADAGHELRTPLTSLRTNLELLIASSEPGAPPVPPEDMAELRVDVIAQIEELSTLVGDLVDLAREDAPEVVHEEVDLSEVLDRSLERVRRRRSDVDFWVQAAPWYVFGESAGLSRAVLNILDNAAKWSPPGSPVQVVLRQLDPTRAELTVADSGPGIPQEERDLIFERFYRSTASRSMPGSGLGLAIVRQVVTLHGGTVSAEQSESGGALIRLTLPGRPMPMEPPPRIVSQ
ncbi:HAMP domain-containing sensor histidine kinase [Williamsia sterculiae]|uniref:Signal transduction histidine-protein kinase/phosphatase MprB n=1 Tax=Williamsia sterculiae TaxID=1344003 RepID=A0A1N7DK10_9NOCA|nr:HAMP domain-containing sensor histidine kinase [Williamsia sterculiae]SIR76085.1 two-component system, OmpR family, sensor histidine kinase MprB [Williamsia sterculiae]